MTRRVALAGALALLVAGLGLGAWHREDGARARQAQRLFQACREGDTRWVVRLVERDPSLVRSTVRSGQTPLHLAVDNFQMDIVDLLTSRGADPDAEARGGQTPLHFAAQRGFRRIAQHLLDHGAPLDAADDDGWTPLHWAVYLGYDDLVSALVERGADIHRRDVWGRLPMDYALRLGPPSLVDRLEPGASARLQARMTPLTSLAARGMYDEVIEAVQRDPSLVEARDSYGCNLLHWALRRRHTYLAVNASEGPFGDRAMVAPGPLGLTPLHLARPRIDTDVQDEDGRTPLHWALKLRNGDMARRLLAAGARLDLRDHRGRTPLALARQQCLDDVVREMVDRGAPR